MYLVAYARKIALSAKIIAILALLCATHSTAQQPSPSVSEEQARTILNKSPEARDDKDWSLLNLYYLNRKKYDELIGAAQSWKGLSSKYSAQQAIADNYITIALSSSGRIEEAKSLYESYEKTDISKFDTIAKRSVSGIFSNASNLYTKTSPPDYNQALKYINLALGAAENCPTEKDILEICIPTFERKFAILFKMRPMNGDAIYESYISAFKLSKESSNPQIIKYHIETSANLGNFLFRAKPEDMKEGIRIFEYIHMRYLQASPEIAEHANKYIYGVAQYLEKKSSSAEYAAAVELYGMTASRSFSHSNPRLDVIAANSLYHIAQLNETRLGNIDKAKRTYRDILARYESSTNPEIITLVNQARQKIDTLMR